MHGSVGIGSFHRKGCANIRPGKNDEAVAGRPSRIERVLPNEENGRTAIERHTYKMWIWIMRVARRCRNLLPVGHPGWITLQIDCIGYNSRLCTIGLHHPQERPLALAD